MLGDANDLILPAEDEGQYSEVQVAGSYEQEIVTAKSYLQKASTFSGDNL